MTATITRRAWVEQIMGLPISVHVRGPHPAGTHVEERIASVFADLRHADAVLSPYRDDSDISRWWPRYDPSGLVKRRSGAVATSGPAHRGAHIIDPYTRRPATGVRAVTVVGPDLMWTDVYATAAAARGGASTDWLDGLDGYEAMLVTSSGLLRTTRGWPTA